MSEGASTFWAAFGGAAAAGILGIVGVILTEYYRHRINMTPKVTVKGSLGYILNPIQSDKKQYFFFEASNKGSNAVSLSEFGLLYKNKEHGQLQVMPQAGHKFPFLLLPGKRLRQWTEVEGLALNLDKSGRKPSDLSKIWFRSEVGDVFCGKVPSYAIAGIQKAFNAASKKAT